MSIGWFQANPVGLAGAAGVCVRLRRVFEKPLPDCGTNYDVVRGMERTRNCCFFEQILRDSNDQVRGFAGSSFLLDSIH